MLKSILRNKGLWSLSALPLLFTLAVLPKFPEELPLHYNAAGEIDRWGSKYEELVFPILILLISAFWQALIAAYEKKQRRLGDCKEAAETENNIKLLRLVACGEAVMFGVMQLFILYSAYHTANLGVESNVIDFPKVCNVLMGIFMMVLGSFVPKAKINSVLGFRTAKTMSDPEIWQKANRFAGISLIVCGGLTILFSLVLEGMAGTFVLLGLLLLMTIIDLIYAASL